MHKTKILYVVLKAEPGGVTTHLLDLLRAYVGQYDLALAVGEEGLLSTQARALGIPVHLVRHMRRALHPLRDWRATRHLMQIVAQFQPDLIHTHSFKGGLIGRLAAKRFGIPVVHTPHAWPFTQGVPKHWELISVPIERALARISSRIICVSGDERQLAMRYHVGTQPQLTVIHNGIPDRERPPRRENPESAPVITMVARFVPQKAQQLLIAALSAIHSPYELWLVGDGELTSQARQDVERLGLGQRVRFWGNREDVPELLAQTDVFALITNWESFPITIIEAMRYRLPVIASDVGGVREAVLDGRTGFVIPRADQALLMERLAQLLDSAVLRTQMGAEGYEHYRMHFGIDQMIGKTRAVYEEVIGRPG